MSETIAFINLLN